MPEQTLVSIGVWAPHASRVEAVLTDGTRLPLVRLTDVRQAPHLATTEPSLGSPEEDVEIAHADQVWTVDLAAGTDYLLSVDGREPLPHARSMWQPNGVHGPSRVFDVTAFEWSDPEWTGIDVLGRVFYELHVGTFTEAGTLDAAIERLPHLKRLGVDVVELMPLAAFDGVRGWGYDGVDLYAVHEAYGGPEALMRFVDAAHGLGLAVCLDVVYNHFGPSGNYWAQFGPYLTQKHQTPWGDAVNLDDENSAGVRRFIIDNALMWIRDFHVDALRLDAIHALQDESDLHVIAQLAEEVHALGVRLGRQVAVTAESDLNDARLVSDPPDGSGVDAQWDDDFHHALHSYLTGERFGYYVDFGAPETLEKALTRVFVHDGTFSTFRGREWGAPVGDDIDRRRFIVASQNHDQVGNRGLGDRPDARLDPGVIAGGAALLLLSPYTPMLFMGQEWGTRRPFLFFTDHNAELGELIKAGRTAEFADHGWHEIYGSDLQVPDPQALSTFTDSKLDWSETGQDAHAAMLDWHARLIALRTEQLAGGGRRVTCTHGADWFRMDHGPLTVVVAPRAGEVEVPVDRRTIVERWGEAELTADGVRLGPHSVVVLAD